MKGAREEEENPGVWLLDLIQVMLCQELLLRRRERREKESFIDSRYKK